MFVAPSTILAHIALAVSAINAFYQPPATGAPPVNTSAAFHLQFVGTYAAGFFDHSASEVCAYHPASKRLFVVNGAMGVDMLDISDPTAPTLLRTIRACGANSVAVHGDLVAVALSPKAKDARGEVVFLTPDGAEVGRVHVGYGPDMVTFTPDGKRLLVANEGEPDDQGLVDPDGSVSIIELIDGPAKAAVREAGFGAFEAQRAALEAQGVHLPVPGRTLAQQFEPEFIAVAPDGKRAWVTIQEANAVAVVDVDACAVVEVIPLGLKDFSKCGLDASDRDNRINIARWPVLALRQPDGIVVWQGPESGSGAVFIALAEEGESRETSDYNETARVARLPLDPVTFPLRESHQEGWSRTDLVKGDYLGRLKVSKPACDTNGDGYADRLVTFGGRGISIWQVAPGPARMVWDSGSVVEQTIAKRMPEAFNADNATSPSRDARSSSKGPEPEGLAMIELGGRRLLAAGLERAGGVMLWDATDPAAPVLLDYANRRDPSVGLSKDKDNDRIPDDPAAAGDLGPEGLLMIPADRSPDGTTLLVVCNEVSGTTTLWRIVPGHAPVGDPQRGL